MILTIRVAPPNSVILITGREVDEIPESMRGGTVAATATCVAVGTLSEMDGETTVSLTDNFSQLGNSALKRLFAGVLHTRVAEVHVRTVLLDSLLILPTGWSAHHLEVWANDEFEPSVIGIVVRDVNEQGKASD